MADADARDPLTEAGPSSGCPDENVLLDYVEGRLSEEDRSKIELHLDGCESCLALTCARSGRSPEFVSTVEDVGRPSQHERASGLARGSVVGRYQVIRMIGQGGMGSVYEAYDPQLDRKVALKLVRAGRLADPQLRARLAREARTMAKLAHANVVTVFDAGEFGHDFFIAMELVSGVTLRVWLSSMDRSYEDTMRVMVGAGRGLTAAHAAGIVHRDFKPENVLVDKDGRVAVTDFGLAAPPPREVPADVEDVGVRSTNTVTLAGTVIGTPRYMSPEQYAGEKLDARSDQFSFAVVLYEALYKERPFEGANIAEVSLLAKEGRFRPPPPRSDVPAHVGKALVRALSPAPSDRFASLDELLLAIDAPAASARPRSRSSRWSLAVLATSFALLLVLGASLRARPHSASTTTAASSRATAPPVGRRAGGRTPVFILPVENRSGDSRFDDTIDAFVGETLYASKRIDPYRPAEWQALAPELGVEATSSGEKVAKALLERDGGAVVVVRSSLLPVGEGLRLSLSARDAASEGSLLDASKEATSPSLVLASATALAREIRSALGDPPQPSETTTLSSSVDAAHAWAEGLRVLRTAGAFHAVDSFRRAVREDPEFSEARADLSLALYDIIDLADSATEAAIALKHADRLGDRRRLKLLGDFYGASGRYAESIGAFELLLNAWPGDLGTEVAISATAVEARQWPLAVELSRRAVTDHAESGVARQNLVYAEVASGSLEDAVRDGEATLAAFKQPSRFTFAHLEVAQALLGHRADALRTLQSLEALDAEYADESRADLAFYEGRFDDAAALLKGQVDQAIARHDVPGASRTEYVVLAELELRQGDTAHAFAFANAAIPGSALANEYIGYAVARALVASGHEDTARKVVRGWEESASVDGRTYAALVRGDILRAHGQADEAIRAYRDAGQFADEWLVHERLGQAYVSSHAWKEAIQELSLCIARRGEGAVVSTPSLHFLPPVYYGLAVAKQGQGDPDAATAFESFLSIEPNASKDPLVTDARRRLAMLAAHR